MPHPGAFRFQSARAAFAALLKTVSPSAVWMPSYICDAMLLPLTRARIPVKFFGIDARFEVEAGVDVGAGELLLFVDYFGTCRRAVDALFERFEPQRIVMDNAQSLYVPPRACLATLYSPRKFFGVPDGGFLATQLKVDVPTEEDTGSFSRSEHLLRRHAGSAVEGYPAFRRAEESLDDITPRRMSRLTTRLLESVDYDAARQRRNANFRFLHEHLGRLNELRIDPGDVDGPLCYPLLFRPGTRERLLRENIFVPTYWPEVLARATTGRFEAELVERCLPLPCDQRYGRAELQRVVDVVQAN